MQAGENPTAALAALVPQPIPVDGTGEVVRPFTLALYAALDRIHSPLLYGGVGTDALALLPSLYIATHDPGEWYKPELLARATEWADALPPQALPALRDACAAQIRAVLDVTPEADPKKKAGGDTTDG